MPAWASSGLTPDETADVVAGMDGIVSEYIDTVRQKSQAQ